MTVISPIEMIRTKLQSEQLSYSQIRKFLGQSIKTGGVTMLWKGLGPTLLRDVPFSGKIHVDVEIHLAMLGDLFIEWYVINFFMV